MQSTRRLLIPSGGLGVVAPGAFVCRSCRAHLGHSRRSYSASSPAASPLPSGTPTAGLARLSSRRLISVSGPDAAKYLQGVITSSILDGDGQPRTKGFYTAFLNAQGRVLYDAFVYPDTLVARDRPAGESFLVEVDASQADRLQRHIKRYKLRARFAVRLLDHGEASIWHAWDTTTTDRRPLPSSSPESSAAAAAAATSGVIRLDDPRAPGLGTRFVTTTTTNTSGDTPFVSSSDNDAAAPPAVDESAYRLHRYLHGVPEGQDEMLHEQALPQESNLDVMGGAIDFHKGCYVGQELTIRTRHRGVVRKRILPCVLYGEDRAAPTQLAYYYDGDGGGQGDHQRPVTADMIPEGASIGRAEKKARSAGKWLRGLGNVGLALCRLETMTDLVLPGETAAAAYSAENEFVMLARPAGGDGDEYAVRVKAFVPEWLRRGLEGQATSRGSVS